jgi:cephalosporin hydroxylase
MEEASRPDWSDVGFEGGEVVRQFHDLYHLNRKQTLGNTRWLGSPAIKVPFDLWIYQEILHDERTRPDLIVETGTMWGGSALFLASVLDLIGSGRVVTIDVTPHDRLPEHPRITYLTGSSIDSTIVDAVAARVERDDRVMVILDSRHTREHVLAEMRAYGPLVTEGKYMVVEDTSLNSWESYRFPGPLDGPLEAVREFLAEDATFVIDRSREKFFVTSNPHGYLRKLGSG